MSDVVLSFCDLTEKFVDPWVEYGYTAILVDPQHKTGVSYDNRVIRVGHIIDHPETWSVVKKHIDRLALVAGFPPCTDVAVSGSRWFEDKRKADPFFQTKAALVAEQCRVVGQLSGAPWFFENPVSVFSSIFGKPTHTHTHIPPLAVQRAVPGGQLHQEDVSVERKRVQDAEPSCGFVSA